MKKVSQDQKTKNKLMNKINTKQQNFYQHKSAF